MAIVPDGLTGIGGVEFREFAGHGIACGDFMGNGSLLYVADDAGDSFGEISSGRRAVDGIDGDGRNFIEPVCSAVYGVDLRFEKVGGRGRGGGV